MLLAAACGGETGSTPLADVTDAVSPPAPADVAVDAALPPICPPGARPATCASPFRVTVCADDGSGWIERDCAEGER